MVFDHCNYDVSYLLTHFSPLLSFPLLSIRHPLSVVKSLQKRDNLAAEKAYLLWFTHVITALIFSNRKNLSLVDYDFFMQHPSSELERLAKEFNLYVDNDELQVFLDQFIDNNLRHTHYALNDLLLDQACPYPVKDIYAYLLQIASGEAACNISELDERVQQWSKYLDFGRAPFVIIDSLYSSIVAAEKSMAEQVRLLTLKDHLISNLEHFNADRAEKVEKLYSATLERDAHIEKLNLQLRATITDKDENIARMNFELLCSKDELNKLFLATQDEINKLFLATQERDQHIAQLNNKVEQISKYNQMILQSRSWRLTRPLRVAMRLIKHGLNVNYKSKLLLGARKLNQKLPRFLQNINRALFGKWLRSLVSQPAVLITAEYQESLPQQLSATESPIVPVASSGKDFIVWGVIDWHFRHQRPQQIAQALAAEGDRVFYVSSNLLEARTAGFSVEPLDKDGRLFQIHLCVNTPTVIYHHAPSADVKQALFKSIGELLLWAKAGQIFNIVQHPFWSPIAQQLPNSQLIYDCMDHHEGFENTGKEVIALEHELFRVADLTITTSGFLDDIVAKFTPRREIIRNAGEFEYFSKTPRTIYRDPQGRKIIGYYGAIAEWFDIELIRKISQQFPDCMLLLVGADTVNAASQLSDQKNIIFTGEVPYKELTHYLYAFDVCLLPFKVIPLILATNPVKVYEYLGAGKSVVAVDVPEIKQFGELVCVGKNHEHFIEQIGVALSLPVTETDVSARKQFAEQQTWHHRARDLARAVNTLKQPKVSVIVVTYNNLDLTKACLHSLEIYSHYSNYEVIVVDNASSDDSPNYLREWVAQGDNRTIILNPDNKGFAAGNNQGLLAATGDYLVLLNNDTYVTPGWISSLVKHIERDPKIGLLGPVTCNIGNEAKININYTNMSEMLAESSKFTLRHIGHLTPLRTAAFFCVMISRAAYEKVGLLDEVFGIGFFEDDDYCRRVEQAGFTIYCADDVFIHHHLSASFNKLKLETRQKLFEENKVTYEKKWGPWIPHVYRPGVS